MKKTIKNLLVFVIMFVTFISFNVKVNAKIVTSDEIGANTYVIGTSMFTREQSQTYDGVLTTQRIMLASKTIQGSDLADMVIYYKNARGVWVDAISNQEIATPPSTFKILNVDMEALPDIPEPSISVQYWLNENDVFVADVGAGADDAAIVECHDDGYGGEECTFKYENVDVFEEGNETPVMTIPLGGVETYTNVPINGTKQLTAKAYIMDGENKVYGDDSAVFNVGVTLATPTLASNPIAPTPEANSVYYEITISSLETDIIPESDFYSGQQGQGVTAYAGVDLFKKSDNSYLGTIALEGQEAIFTAGLNNIDANAITTIYGKGYAIVNNAKVYGPASNEIMINKTLPSLVFMPGPSQGGCNEGSCYYEFGVDSSSNALIEAMVGQTPVLSFEGYGIFEVGNDTPVAHSTTPDEVVTIEGIAEGTVKQYIAKPYVTVNGNKVYGPESNKAIKVVYIDDWRIDESEATEVEGVKRVVISIDQSSNAYLENFDGFRVYNSDGMTLIGSKGIDETLTITENDASNITVELYTTVEEASTTLYTKDKTLKFVIGD